ncbi:MAG: hypothetical protein JNL63_01700 [Bacteroidia bacterium]|nr:hypothetical protein [Bacteroidia bacterium]
MRTITSILFFLAISTLSKSQTEKLNQLDSAGNKDGKWILYLDFKGDKVKDSSNAFYYRYTYYDHGIHIYPMGGFIGKNGKIESTTNDNHQTGKIKLLNGEYRCFDNKGRLIFIHVFKNGEYVSYKEFYKTGELQTYFDYTKHCNEQPRSWYIYSYDKKGIITYTECVSKNKNGKWPKMRG